MIGGGRITRASATRASLKRISEPLPIVVWAWAVAFAAAGAWPHFSSEPFPLPGLRKLAEGDKYGLFLQVSAVVSAAVWLVWRSRQTRERLLVFQGVALALSVQGFLYIGLPFGLAFACFASIARARGAEQDRR